MSKVKILIIEDEIVVGLDLKLAVNDMGYHVTKIAKNLRSTLDSLKKEEPELIIMDINLKNSVDGIKIAQKIKEIKNIPIVYLTAFNDEETIKRAIATNPSGYLTKPFRKNDLQSTIMLALHKSTQDTLFSNTEERYHIGENYYFDKSKLELYYQDTKIKLTKKEKILLDILIRAKGNIVSLEDLESLIWVNIPASSSSLRTLIYRLRTKLEYKVIETVPYYGCKIPLLNSNN